MKNSQGGGDEPSWNQEASEERVAASQPSSPDSWATAPSPAPGPTTVALPAHQPAEGVSSERTPLAHEPNHRLSEALSLAGAGSTQRGPVLSALVALSALCVVAATLLAAAHAASLYRFVASSWHHSASRSLVSVAIRSYGLLFCAAVVVVELELVTAATESVLSRYWSLRGLAYSFVGVLAYADADDDACRRARRDAPAAWRDNRVLSYSLYLRSCAAAMSALGAVYFLLALCCCKRIKDSLAADYKRQLLQNELHSAITAELAQRPAVHPVNADVV